MRHQGPCIACLLVVLGVGSERAVANGVIVVPVQTTVLVPRTGIVQRAPVNGPAYKGHLHRLFRRGSVPVCETVTYYEVMTAPSTVIVSNRRRPCFPPTPPPSPAPSPQAPEPPHPSPQAPHVHPTPSPQTAAGLPGRCGRCWPWCFMVRKELRCTCCVHMKRDVVDAAEAADLVNKINNGEIDYLPIQWTPYVADAVDKAVTTADPPGSDPIPCPPTAP